MSDNEEPAPVESPRSVAYLPELPSQPVLNIHEEDINVVIDLLLKSVDELVWLIHHRRSEI